MKKQVSRRPSRATPAKKKVAPAVTQLPAPRKAATPSRRSGPVAPPGGGNELTALLERIVGILEQARARVVRAVNSEMVPRAKLGALVGDLVWLDELAEGNRGVAPLLEEVRKFHEGSLRGEYYDSFAVNSKNFMEQSEGTEAFIAEFDRLAGKCVRAAEKGPRAPVRQAFELLFALLRHIDEDPDSVVFFADEAGSWQVDVDWRTVLPAYFRCLADGTPGEEFAREVDRVITNFADYERPKHLAAARRAANPEPRAALRRLPAREGRR